VYLYLSIHSHACTCFYSLIACSMSKCCVNLNMIYNMIYDPAIKVWGSLSEAGYQWPSVFSLSLPRCVLELLLLLNANRKPNGSRTRGSVWPCGHQKWPKRPWSRKAHVINILKTKRQTAIDQSPILFPLSFTSPSTWHICLVPAQNSHTVYMSYLTHQKYSSFINYALNHYQVPPRNN